MLYKEDNLRARRVCVRIITNMVRWIRCEFVKMTLVNTLKGVRLLTSQHDSSFAIAKKELCALKWFQRPAQRYGDYIEEMTQNLCVVN